jgi:hypothetical protein
MTTPVDPEVDRALKALDVAEAKYYNGTPGPYTLDGSYSRAAFERLIEITESHWRLEFSESDCTISVYGDHSPAHARLAELVRDGIKHAITDHLRTAPPSGVPYLDGHPLRAFHRLFLNGGGSIKVHLTAQRGANHATYPTNSETRKKDGDVYKEGDSVFVMNPAFTTSGECVPVVFFEGGVCNEPMQVLVWEAERGFEAGIPLMVAAKVNVGRAFFSEMFLLSI